MVQVTFDTKTDTLEELEETLALLQQAIERRKSESPEARAAPASKLDMPTVEEATIDTPFLKITVKDKPDQRTERPQVPTLNQLIHDNSLTEEELTKMFKEQLASEPQKPRHEKKVEEDAYIEIIEYADERGK